MIKDKKELVSKPTFDLSMITPELFRNVRIQSFSPEITDDIIFRNYELSVLKFLVKGFLFCSLLVLVLYLNF